MKPIGGYFGLELRTGIEYYPDAIRLNTGRNAFEYILRAKGYKKVFMPFYTCDVMFEPINKLELEYEFYHINKQLEPIFDYKRICKTDAFIYTNYFGLKSSFVKKLSMYYPNLIIDNTQAFYEKPIAGIDTFYSPRKFFGVPDGAYLYTDKLLLDPNFPVAKSMSRISHLIKRIEVGAQAGYHDFKSNDDSLKNQSIKLMSSLTQALLCNIDYINVKELRKRNFLILHENLKDSNELELNIDNIAGPMVYPYLNTKIKLLKQKLIQNNIFIATYWPSVLEITKKNDFENCLTEQTLFLPVDQRYGVNEMQYILKLIK